MAIPWAQIKEEYVTTNTSHRKLAEKYNISNVAVSIHAKNEGWSKLREEYVRGKRQEENDKKPSAKAVTEMISYGAKDSADESKREKFRRYAIYSKNLQPIDINDELAVESRINEYFDCCYQNDIKPQKPGLAKWIGVTRKTLDMWHNGEARGPAYRALIERAYLLLEEDLYEQLQSGQISPPSGIFLLKNMFGYRDQQDIVVAPKNPLGDLQNPEELRKRIEGTVVVEDEEGQK